MNGKQYFKNQLPVILINLLGMLALALFLIASGNGIQTVLFILVVWLIVLASCLLLFYFSRKKYLNKLLDKEAFDRRGLIYGIGHAVYSISDPRADIFRAFVKKLAEEKGRQNDFKLYSMVERLAPQVIGERRHIYKGVSANVDFYSGFVYSMLDLPLKLFTPMSLNG